MGNARKNYTKLVYFFTDMADDDGRVIFKADTPYTVVDQMVQNEDLLRLSLDDIWVDFRVEFQPDIQ